MKRKFVAGIGDLCVLIPGMKFRYMGGVYMLIMVDPVNTPLYVLADMEDGHTFPVSIVRTATYLSEIATMMNNDDFWELINEA